MSDYLLEIDEVKTYFPVFKGLVFERRVAAVKAVDGVTLRLRRGEVVGLVGESGCGKSTLARTIVRLVTPTAGTVVFEGRNLAELSRGDLRKLRPAIQVIFQDPYASLNPRMTAFSIIAEPMLAHSLVSRDKAAARVADLMDRVGLAPRFMRQYPHEFSGGQRQRIAIARALALEPKLIIADEPVSALDVSVQAQILNLIARLCKETDLTLLFISHDLAVVRHIAERIAVMYLGKIVEVAGADTLFTTPRHPYTQALLSAVPVPDPDRERARRPIALAGEPPSPLNPPAGCAFHPRCPFADEHCAETASQLEACGAHHEAACLRLDVIPRE